jgi:YjbE family integral membrane protein
MEILSLEFLSALMAIVVIDLVLAGDNAIVIALAARNVPKHLQKKAIIWGTVGAIAVRTTMTVAVVWLLGIPGLMLAGGALLVWIAYKLLVPEAPGDGEAKISAANSFAGAIRTVIVADVVMGLDNVLAVAGAANGSFALVAIGLLISIPIVVWGSTLLLKFIERFPGFIYVGAGVLAVTAAKMMSSEPFVKDALAASDWTTPLLYAVTVAGVLWSGFAASRRQLARDIDGLQRVMPSGGAPAAAGIETAAPIHTPDTSRHAAAAASSGGHAVMKVLIPVDGSSNTRHALQRVVEEFVRHPGMEVHLLNVQPVFSRHISRFVKRRNLNAWQQDEAQHALRPARQWLSKQNIPFTAHVATGRKAELIAETAKRLQCDHIVMGTARKNSLTRMLQDSVTNKVLELTRVPVEVVSGASISKLERYGLPAGIGAIIGVMALAAAD